MQLRNGGVVFDLVIFSLFPLAMIVAAVSDLRSMTISNRLTAGLALAFPVVALWCGTELSQIALHMSAGFAMLVVGYAFFAFGWIGGGDAKLFAATALWLGWTPLFEYAFYASLLGGGLTFLIVLCRGVPLPDWLRRQTWLARLHNAKEGIPYGVALGMAGLLIYPATPLVPLILR